MGRRYITRKLLLQPPTALTMTLNRCKFIVLCNSIPLTVSNGQVVMQSEKNNIKRIACKVYSVCVVKAKKKLSTICWLPELHKKPYKARFIAGSSSCTTTELV